MSCSQKAVRRQSGGSQEAVRRQSGGSQEADHEADQKAIQKAARKAPQNSPCSLAVPDPARDICAMRSPISVLALLVLVACESGRAAAGPVILGAAGSLAAPLRVACDSFTARTGVGVVI